MIGSPGLLIKPPRPFTSGRVQFSNPAPPPFSPLDIAWSAAWWASNPNQSFTPDQSVSSWSDATGGGRHLHDHAVGASIRPEYRASVAGLNSKPALQFNATSDFLATTANVWTSGHGMPYDIFVVLKQAAVSVGTYRVITSTLSAITNTPEILTNSDSQWWAFAGGPGYVGGGTVDTNGHAMMARFTGGAGTLLEVDGSVVATDTEGNKNLPDFIVNVRSSSTFYWGGHLAFVGVKFGTLTTTERSNLYTWSRSFYGTP